MEVAISNADSLPSNCLVSVRFGGVRRQAPLDKIKNSTLKFPSTTDNCADPLKIEVLQPIAGARLVLQRKEANYQVDLSGKGKGGKDGMNIGVQVRHCPSEATIASPMNSRPVLPAKYQDAAVSAREYLETHGLLRYIQGLLHTIIQVRPEDPFSFMVEQIGAVVPLKPEDPPARTPSEAGREENDVTLAPEQATDLERARDTARDALAAAASTGQLAAALAPAAQMQTAPAAAEPSAAMPQASVPHGPTRYHNQSLSMQIVRYAMTCAVQNGKLASNGEFEDSKAVVDDEPLLPPPVPTFCPPAPSEPPPPLPMQAKEVPEADEEEQKAADDLREQAFASLRTAAEDGQLLAALGNLKDSAPQDGAFEVANEVSINPIDLEIQQFPEDLQLEILELGQKAQICLFEAAADGRLEASLLEMQTLRQTARTVLVQGAVNGRFSGNESLPDEAFVDVDQARSDLQATLLKASLNGSLHSALQSTDSQAAAGQDLEEVRERIQGVLLTANENGKLDTTLDGIQRQRQGEVESVAVLQQKALQVLVSASADGRLDTAAEKVQKQSDAGAEPPPVPPAAAEPAAPPPPASAPPPLPESQEREAPAEEEAAKSAPPPAPAPQADAETTPSLAAAPLEPEPAPPPAEMQEIEEEPSHHNGASGVAPPDHHNMASGAVGEGLGVQPQPTPPSSQVAEAAPVSAIVVEVPADVVQSVPVVVEPAEQEDTEPWSYPEHHNMASGSAEQAAEVAAQAAEPGSPMVTTEAEQRTASRSSTAPPGTALPVLLPFAEYYARSFSSAVIVEGMARTLFPPSGSRLSVSTSADPIAAPAAPPTPAGNAEDIRQINLAIMELRKENTWLKDSLGGMHEELDYLKRENAMLSNLRPTTS